MDLRQEVLDANRWIVDRNLVELTWGNVSAISDDRKKIVIKPSGVKLHHATAKEMSEISRDGVLIAGKKPSVDTPSHIEIYNAFPKIKSVIHTHSKYATIFAQANRCIPCLGTTHADYFYGDVPCVPHPQAPEVNNGYEMHTGRIIGEYFTKNKINYLHTPACIVQGHGVFVWGENISTTLETAYVLEVISEMAFKTLMLEPKAKLERYVRDKHFFRKHGTTKYYGQ